jgi:hypothetical protein
LSFAGGPGGAAVGQGLGGGLGGGVAGEVHGEVGQLGQHAQVARGAVFGVLRLAGWEGVQ